MNIKTLPISEARRKIFDIAEDVQRPNIYYTLTEKGRPKAVILSADEFESWVETLEVMQDFPDLKKDIDETHEDFRTGRYQTYATLDDVLKKEGYIYVGGKLTRKHAVSRKIQARGTKSARTATRKR